MDTDRMPAGLATKGKRLWREALALRSFNIGELVVLEEACRLADRLDGLAGLLDGSSASWGRIVLAPNADCPELKIDEALSAARLHAATLSRLISDLKLPAADGAEEGGDVLDELAAARAGRVPGAAAL